MSIDQFSTYYDLLEIQPNASPQEVRAAYLRTRSAYKKENPALYTLFEEGETEGILKHIEEAYQVLSHPEKRRNYDNLNLILVAGSQPELSLTLATQPQSEQTTIPTPPPPPPQAAPARAPTARLNTHHDIENEVDWHGPSIKKIRETSGISIEELSEQTKISKRYINAIEEEKFEHLPAPVFVRGFVVQIAKTLKLPHEKVAAAFLVRYSAAFNDREKNK